MNILLTGASGFVGRAVERRMQSCSDIHLSVVIRKQESGRSLSSAHLIDDISGETDWCKALANQDVVIHLAARVHVMNEESAKMLVEYRRINVEGTINLARQAAASGVKRFVFLSSIKVNGEGTRPGRVYTAEDPHCPEDAYGLSKAEAELRLMQVANETGMEVTIIRPPLVYGPGAKGNFANLVRLIASEWPLPLGSVTYNRRSFIALDNLVDFIMTCSTHVKAANQIFLVSDGEDLSTTELFRRIAKAMNRRVHLLPIPPAFLSSCAYLLGKKSLARRLLGSLEIDTSKTQELLGWEPPLTVDEGLRRAVEQSV